MLKHVISDFIESVEEPLKKEYSFIKSNDWSTNDSLDKREAECNLHATITDRAVKTAKDLHKIAIKDLSHSSVKAVMKLVKDIYELYEKRYYNYIKKQDWTKYLKEGRSVVEVEKEMKFQSDIRNQLNSMKRTMRDINFGEDSDEVDIKLLNDAPVPLLMKEVFEESFPEMKEIIAKKNEESKTVTKTKRSPRKNTKVSK